MSAQALSRSVSALGALLALTGSARADDAVADTRTASLSWVRLPGSEQCVGLVELQAAVVERLGRDPFLPGAGLLIEGWVSPQGAGHRAVLRVKGHAVGAVRTLETDDADCRNLGDAVGFALALAIDPAAVLTPPARGPLPPPPQPKPPPPAPVEPPPAPAPSTAPAAPLPPVLRAERSRSAELSARALVGVGQLPQLAWGVGVAGLAELAPRARVLLGASVLPEQRTDSGTAGFGLSYLEAGMCYRPWVPLDACVVAQAGVLHSIAHAPRPVDPGDKPWLAGGAVVRVSGGLGAGVRVELGTSLAVPMLEHDFVLRGDGRRVFSPAKLVGTGFVGLGFEP